MIKKTANELGWEYKETKSALNEFLDSQELIKADQVYEVYLNSDNFVKRWQDFNRIMYMNLNNIDEVSAISKLLNVNSCFKALAFFNLYDFRNQAMDFKKLVNIPLLKEINIYSSAHSILFHDGKKSFINWTTPVLIDENTSSDGLLMNIIDSPNELSYNFLSSFIRDRISQARADKGVVIHDLSDLADLVIKIISKFDLFAFNIDEIQDFYNICYMNPNFIKNREFLLDIYKNINNQGLTKREITHRRNWLWYILSKELQAYGLGIRASFRKVAELVGENFSDSVKTRHYEIEREVKTQNITINEIINKYKLRDELDFYLTKGGYKRPYNPIEYN